MNQSPNPSIFLRVMDTLQALLIASIIGTILIGASSVFADDSAFFDESGQMQMDGTWSPMAPNSRRTTEEDHRQYNAWTNAETLRTNEALIDEYYSSKPTAPPSGSSDYWITDSNGRSTWCRPIGSRTVICQ